MNGGGDFPVGRQEWGGTLALLEEIRSDIKDDIRDLKSGQADLSKQLAETDRRITSRQEIANGRTAANEAAVKAVAADLLVVSADVKHVREKGCQERERHLVMIDALADAGVMPSTGELTDALTRPTWTRRHKAVASVVGIGGLGLGSLLPHVGPFLHWLATLIERAPKP